MGAQHSAYQVVCDAGPLIHLDELGCLELLADFADILVPEQVWKEVQRHRSPALTHPQVELQQVSLPLNTQPAFQSIIRTLALDLGEQAALSLMARFPDAIFLTDDAAARLAANTLGYKVHGTIGILLRAIRRQQRSRNEVLETLRAIPTRSTLHVRQQFLNEIIDEVEQHE